MPPTPALDRDAMTAFLAEVFPELDHGGRSWAIDAVGHGTARMRLLHHPKYLRPGGTMSGPAMMTIADLAIYVAVLSVVGKVPLAVTTNLSIHFLAKPAPGDLIADCRLLKAGKRLCIGEARILSGEGAGETLVAHATATYSVPPMDR